RRKRRKRKRRRRSARVGRGRRSDLEGSMSDRPYGLIEMGSNSLKFYLVEIVRDGFSVKTHKVPWKIAHEFFSAGRIGETAFQDVVTSIRSVEKVSGGVPLKNMLSIATGVFREVPDIKALASRVEAETGVRVRVITGEDEAKLMAKAFPKEKRAKLAVLADLGGATTEWAAIDGGDVRACGSLPLGAIRNEYRFRRLRSDPERYLAESAEHCDAVLAPVSAPGGASVLATGGTAKAVAACLEKDVVPAGELRELLLRVAREGAPEVLKPERRAVFLPGLVILERLVARC